MPVEAGKAMLGRVADAFCPLEIFRVAAPLVLSLILANLGIPLICFSGGDEQMSFGSDEGIPPYSEASSSTLEANPSKQLLPNASSSAPDHSDASGSPEKSALDERKEELLLSNIEEKKGDLGTGQRLSDVRKEVETDFHITTKGQEFELIKEIQKEAGAKKEDCPATNCAFNSIKEYQSHVQDGRGGGKPNDGNNR